MARPESAKDRKGTTIVSGTVAEPAASLLGLLAALSPGVADHGRDANLADGADSSPSVPARGNVDGGAGDEVIIDAHGEVLGGVCIKSGEGAIEGEKHSGTDHRRQPSTAATVEGLGTDQVTVTRVDDEGCKAISHVDFGTAEATPTPTPTLDADPNSDGDTDLDADTDPDRWRGRRHADPDSDGDPKEALPVGTRRLLSVGAGRPAPALTGSVPAIALPPVSPGAPPLTRGRAEGRAGACLGTHGDVRGPRSAGGLGHAMVESAPTSGADGPRTRDALSQRIAVRFGSFLHKTPRPTSFD